MSTVLFVKPEKVSIKNHPELTEKWIQDIIADDPSMLGLGDLILKDRERVQPRAGRLDLLLQDSESTSRFEVEIQLGSTDESHIIRTIEYWDIERKRYPQYEHCAVIVAEDITSRFLNVISLFNGTIPIVAIQMNALKVGEHLTLTFTKIIDQLNLGLVDEDEVEATDRAYWENKAAPATMSMADQILKLIKEFEPELELKYNKFYIGLAKNGQPDNFIVLRPKKNFVRIEIRLEKDEKMEGKIDEQGLDLISYSVKSGRYKIRVTKEDITEKHDSLMELIKLAYEQKKN